MQIPGLGKPVVRLAGVVAHLGWWMAWQLRNRPTDGTRTHARARADEPPAS